MPALQVRDLPEDLYRKLSLSAQKENRSITQQTIVLLQQALGTAPSYQERKQQLLEKIKQRNITANDWPEPAELIRADRDR